jgi:GH15 family glucan-1,4-alpha-glucosidase
VNEYPPIDDHGLIGDLQTAALVAGDGTVDWFCAPRFDSPSIFAGLLDRHRGGHFRIAPEGTGHVSKQLYLPGTPILITRFLSPDGVGEVVDFMPIAGDRATEQHRLVRMVRVVRGRMRFQIDCQPRLDYGRDEHTTEVYPDGAVFRGRTLTVGVSVARRDDRLIPEDEVHRDANGVRAAATLNAGDIGGVILETAFDGDVPRAVPAGEVLEMFERTRDFWRNWIGRSRYTGRWREMVERSAMTLKLMTYAPTGALVAAPTAGLPEQIGGERNWDYRYTWVRDGSFSVYALLGLGFTEEADAFLRWLGQRIREADEDGAPLQIMYRVDGSPDLDEEILDHFDGYRGSAPVRIGNGAARQSQLDIYGEALNSLDLADKHGLRMPHDAWRRTSALVDWLGEHWDRPEAGIWETRGGAQDFTYGRLMSWVAFDRAVRLARRRSSSTGTTASARHSSSTTRPTSWTPRCCPCRRWVSCRRTTRCGARRCARWTRSSSRTAWCTGTTRARHPTGCVVRKAPSRCVPSGTSTPSPAPAGSTTRGSPSRRCSRTAAGWACTPRRSRPPASRSATSPRRSAISPSSPPR